MSRTFIKFEIKYKNGDISTIIINPEKVCVAVLEYVNKGKYGWVIDVFMEGNEKNVYEGYSISPVRIPVKSKEEGEKILHKYFSPFMGGETFEL